MGIVAKLSNKPIHDMLEDEAKRLERQLAECREDRDELDKAVDALIEERDQYDADLEECRESLDLSRRARQELERDRVEQAEALVECREELAAAEARSKLEC